MVEAQSQTFTFAELTGVPINTSGWTMQGNAYVGNTPANTGNGEIILTDPIGNQSGSIFYNIPIDLTRCIKWIVEFDFRIAESQSSLPADGIAFCYLDVPPVGFVAGGGLGIPGSANGLKVCIDTWRNCGTDAVPKLQLRWGVGYDNANGLGECQSLPTRNNNDGALSFIRSTQYHKARIVYDAGNISFSINGTQYLNGFQTFNFPGYFGFTASTGGANDRHSIKNVKIYTEMPPSVAGPATASYCPGDSVQLGTSPNSSYIYKWTPSAGLNNPAIANPKMGLLNSGSTILKAKYFVETEFAAKPGCSSRDSVEITLLPNPVALFAFDTSCLPDAVVRFTSLSTFDNKPANGPGYQWHWNFDDPNAISSNPNTSTAQNPTHLYNSQNPRVSLRITTPEGCTNENAFTVTSIVSRPIGRIGISSPTCANFTIQYTDSSIDVQGAGLKRWFWDFGDGNLSTLQNPEHTYNLPGTYLVKFVTAGAGDCTSDTISRSVVVFDNPTARFSSSVPVCLGQPVSFTDKSVVAGVPITSWVWSFGNDTLRTQNPVYAFAHPGTHAVSLLITDQRGCRSTATEAISVNTKPVLDLIAFPRCVQVPVLFSNTVSWPGNASAQLTYRWLFADPAATATNPDTSHNKQPVHTYCQIGSYVTNLRISTAEGCSFDTTYPVAIGAPSSTTFTITNKASLCRNRLVELVNNSQSSGLLSTRLFTDWPRGTLYDANEAPISNGTTIKINYLDQVFNPTQSRFTIRMENTNYFGCVSGFTDSIYFPPLPVAGLTPIGPVCEADNPFALTQGFESTGLPGTGRYTGVGVSSNGVFTPATAGVGAHTISYIFTSTDNCSDTATTQVVVNANPIVSAGPDKTILPSANAVLEGASNLTGSIRWSPATGLTSDTILRPIATPTSDTRYILSVTTQQSCSAIDEVFVTVLPALLVPNAFSPNGDGINDVWNIPSLNSYAGCRVQVFDRFGRAIWESTGYSIPWDGGSKGKQVPAGVFYYIIDPKNGAAVQKGSVTVIR
jgi:gliding motility-associated-like protein